MYKVQQVIRKAINKLFLSNLIFSIFFYLLDLFLKLHGNLQQRWNQEITLQTQN